MAGINKLLQRHIPHMTLAVLVHLLHLHDDRFVGFAIFALVGRTVGRLRCGQRAVGGAALIAAARQIDGRPIGVVFVVVVVVVDVAIVVVVYADIALLLE